MAYRGSMESVGEYEYSKSDLLGHGAFALVYKGRHKVKKDHIVAIKCINKKKVGKTRAVLDKEINILKELQHRNIVQLYEYKESAQSVYLVMEYCNGGDMSEYMHAMGTLSEDTIRVFLKQIASAMAILHSKGIVHRDLKPQNLLLSHKRSEPRPQEITVKVADFGFARYLQGNTMAATLCGSPMYMAPEVITSQHYDAKADLWSIGTIVYQCLTGKPPYPASTPQDLRNLYEKNRRMTPQFPPQTSAELKNLLLGLLQQNIRDRISFQDFFNHPFVAMKTKQSRISNPVPVPVPNQHGGYESSPVSSNNSDPRYVIPISTPPCRDVSSPVDREVALAMSTTSSRASSKDSEDFVIVPHPLGSSSESCGADAASSSRRRGGSVGSGVRYSTGRNSPRDHGRTLSSPSNPQDRRRSLQTPPPLLGSPGSRRGSHQLFTHRKSPHSGGMRHSSNTKDSQQKSKSCDSVRPSPSPIPVPGQVENYERMERKHSTSSCSPASPSSSGMRSHKFSTSTDGGSPVPTAISPLASSPRIEYSPVTSRRTRRSSSCLKPEITTIMENPDDEIGKPTIAGPARQLVARTAINKAQTVPDLVRYEKLHRENVIGRCQSSNRLSEQVMRMLFNTKQQSLFGGSTDLIGRPGFSTGFRGLSSHALRGNTDSGLSLTPPNSPSERHESLRYNSSKNLLHTGYHNPSITEQAKQFILGSPNSGERGHFLSGSPDLSSNVDVTTAHVQPQAMQVHGEKLSAADQVEINESALKFYCHLSDAIHHVASQHALPLDTQFLSRGFLSQSARSKQQEVFSTDPLHNVTQEQRQVEQVLLYLRSLQILATILHTVRNKVNAGQLNLDRDMTKLLCEINKRYKEACQLCQEARSKCDFNSLKQKNFNTADKLLYYYAVNDCRLSVLAEMYEANVQECLTRYKRALVLLEGISLYATDNLDKQRLDKYKSSINHRLKHLKKIWSPASLKQGKTFS